MDPKNFFNPSLNCDPVKLSDVIAEAFLKIFQPKVHLVIVPVLIAENGAKS
jgi:hypothetical protein